MSTKKTSTDEEVAAAEAKKEAKEAAKKPTGLRVAPGKSITSPRGILTSADGTVTPRDFAGDSSVRIKELLEAGVLVK